MKKKVLFIFRENLLREDYNYDPVNNPDDFLYGYNHISMRSTALEYCVRKKYSDSLLNRSITRLEYYINHIIGFPVNLREFITLKNKVNSAGVVVSVNDSSATGLLFWKLVGQIKPSVIVLMQNLPDLIKVHNSLGKYLSKLLLNKAQRILVLSKVAKQILIDELNLNPDKVAIFRFGIDEAFWKKLKKINGRKYILSVGNDSHRDYETLVVAKPKGIELKLVTKRRVKFTNNVVKLGGLTSNELRKMYNECLFAVIPNVKTFSTPAGLSSILQLMACGSTVIASYSPSLDETFEDQKDILFYEPGNRKELNKKINSLIKNKKLRNRMSRAAKNNSRKYTSSNMGMQWNNILREI